VTHTRWLVAMVLLVAAGSAVADCTVETPEVLRDTSEAARVADIAYHDAAGAPCGRSRLEVGDDGRIVYEYGPDEQLAYYYVHVDEGAGQPAYRTYFSGSGEVLFLESFEEAATRYRDASDAPLTPCDVAARLPRLPLHGTWTKTCRGRSER
jgi:hypothetical protein